MEILSFVFQAFEWDGNEEELYGKEDGFVEEETSNLVHEDKCVDEEDNNVRDTFSFACSC